MQILFTCIVVNGKRNTPIFIQCQQSFTQFVMGWWDVEEVRADFMDSLVKLEKKNKLKSPSKNLPTGGKGEFQVL